MDKLLGLVLCGGESRRMGSDKGLLLKDGTPWALHMGLKLSPWKIPVFYSINKGQQTAYKTILPSRHLVVDTLDLPGPLNGLFSLHQRLPKMDILLLACDMIDLDTATIDQMIRAYMENGPFDYYAYREGQEDGFFQPFCGIYTTIGLAAAFDAYRHKLATDHRLQTLLRQGRTRSLSIDRPEAFRNYNNL
ncbi:MAG TPA: molybdenum cofactor guanylyltransferase [Puia sp.]|jgi:molybdopterin-guanine dinucleotide biosynthesis protein A